MSARPLKILYLAPLSPNDSSLYRKWALERLGHTVVGVDSLRYEAQPAVLRKLLFRAQTGPWVTRLNRDILGIAARERPDVFWADKLLGLRPETLQRLRRMGLLSVNYLSDNPFGPRNDPGWRLFRQCLSKFDLHVVPRDCSVDALKAAGARDAMKVQFAFEPTVHFPPPDGWSDSERDREVSFIGTPYDDRAAFLTSLWSNGGVRLTVNGAPSQWLKALRKDAAEGFFAGHPLFGAEYRDAICRSKINLSFVTHSNQDEFAHKSFEIAGCGGFLLAERSAGHAERFKEGEEAEFFEGAEECLAKIKRYLPDQAARSRIAAAGHARAVHDGYDNDSQMQRIIERVLQAGQLRSS